MPAPPFFDRVPTGAAALGAALADAPAAGLPVLVRGRVAQLVGALPTLPAPLPPAAPDPDDIAFAVFDLERPRFLDRPLCERHEVGRPFLLDDGAGGPPALVRLGPSDIGSGRVADELEVRLAAPFSEASDGIRTVLVRALPLGATAVVAGQARLVGPAEARAFGVGPALATGAYRDAPALPLVVAEALWDEPAFAGAIAWRALPWYRKLSLLVRNR